MNTKIETSLHRQIADEQAWILSVLFLLIGVISAAVFIWTATDGPAFRLDDGYIVMNNAQAILNGDASFPDVAPLHGSTSLLHSLAVFALSFLVMPETALFCVAWGAVLAQALGALFLSWKIRLSVGCGLALALLAVTSGDFIQVQVNGVETGWMVAAVLWSLALAVNRPVSGVLAFLAACLPFIRPELAILSVLIVLNALSHTLRSCDFQMARKSCAIFVLVAVALCITQYLLSGALLPATGSAKRYFFEAHFIPWEVRAAWSGVTLSSFALNVGGPVLLALLFPRGSLAWVALVFATITALALGLGHTAILSQNWSRYLYFILPVAIFMLATLFASEELRWRRVASVIVIAGLIYNISTLASKIDDDVITVRDKRATLSQTAEWINKNLNPDETLLLHDIGYVSWATSQRLFDIVGLRSPEALQINRALRHMKGEKGQVDALEAMIGVSGSCTLLVSIGWNNTRDFSGLLEANGWELTPHPGGHPPGHYAYQLSGKSGFNCGQSGRS